MAYSSTKWLITSLQHKSIVHGVYLYQDTSSSTKSKTYDILPVRVIGYDACLARHKEIQDFSCQVIASSRTPEERREVEFFCP